ncbi:uncharacterized protein PV06_09881 [Exophiala oligosperma]|uniref:Ricin B lectin domain-containing protein n=1 Tax=Exophiala oligosperma TaxID=215243 RepID=A0A0D2BKI0_9EURO|nr:uncharacterized protein PV06_09881 [Exophiala oligosperma]KIW37902.1 hypothetical protein PV06_09881 [Exophiala oligosperma]
MAPPMLDPNTWYRIYFNDQGLHYLTTLPNGTSAASKDKTIYNLWQVLTHDDGHFSFRQNRTQVDWWQLGTYLDPYGGQEPDNKPQLQVMTNDTSQRWNIDQWGEQLPWKIRNVELGDPVLDCHKELARVFMKLHPSTGLVNQRWYFTSVAKVQEATTTSTAATTTASSSPTATSTAHVVTITSVPTSSPSSPVQEEESSSDGLSTGAKAGIGIGVCLVAILILAPLVWLLVRRRKRKAKRPSTGTIDSMKPLQLPGNDRGGVYVKPQLPGNTRGGVYVKPQLPGQGSLHLQPSQSGQLSELQATPDIRPTELPADPMAREIMSAASAMPPR